MFLKVHRSMKKFETKVFAPKTNFPRLKLTVCCFSTFNQIKYFHPQLRSQRQIVLTAASSNIASLLLLEGRTTHSKFKIHVPTIDDSICNIH